MDVIKDLEEFINTQSLRVRQKVRNKAIKKIVKNRILIRLSLEKV
jgi:hypothetical protein